MNQKYVVTIDKKAQEVLQAIVAIDTITYYENDNEKRTTYVAYKAKAIRREISVEINLDYRPTVNIR